MNKFLSIAIACVFAAAMFAMPSAQTKVITATGTIIDSITKLPVPQAMVLLYATDTMAIDVNNLGSLKLDTVFTGTDGKFSHPMTVTTSSFILVYGVIKLNYQIKYNVSIILASTVNLGQIKISLVDPAAKDTIVVSGTVVDSATGIGISGALVILSTGNAFDTTGNTVFTSSIGSFTKQTIISKSHDSSIVAYIITSPKYQTKLGQNLATGKQLNLGIIQVKKNALGVRLAIKAGTLQQAANRMKVFALNGKLLYSGKIQSLDKLLLIGTNEAVVELKSGNSAVSTQKYTLAR